MHMPAPGATVCILLQTVRLLYLLYQNETGILYISQQPLILIGLSLFYPSCPCLPFKFASRKVLFMALHLGQVFLAQTLHLQEVVEPIM